MPVYLQTSALVETRRMAHELQKQRQLAHQAEGFAPHRSARGFDARFERLEEALRTGRTGGWSDLTRAADELRLAIEQAINSLAAQVAELTTALRGASHSESTNGRAAHG